MTTLFQSRIAHVSAPHTVDFLKKSILPPGPGEAVIRIQASAICGSDLHIYKGRHPNVPLPATIGHEFSGDIAALGPEVEGLSVGQRVTVEPCITCGVCDACLHGAYGYCDSITFIYRTGEGAMADYITVKASHIYPLPEHLSYDTGALIEPLAVAVHAVRRAEVGLGEIVLIVGAGAIGLLVAALCRRMGAGQVIVSDLIPQRLALAEALGATAVIDAAGEELSARIHALTGGRGVDKSFECVGTGSALHQSIFSLRRNGLATVVGIYEQPEITIAVSRLVSHELRVQGTQGYCWDFPIALQMSREIDLSRLVTHDYPLGELGRALESGLDPTSGSVKILLHP